MGMDNSDIRSEVAAILESKNLTALFQPIVDISRSIVYGHEALIRGPVATKLHSSLDFIRSLRLGGHNA